jgi:regulator of replication initiation timing
VPDDIVKRLRASDGWAVFRASDGCNSIGVDTDLLREAADEIERLRAEAAKLRRRLVVLGGYGRSHLHVEYPDGRPDRVAVVTDAVESLIDGHNELVGEVERLRAENTAMRAVVRNMACTEATHEDVYYSWESIVRTADGIVAEIINNARSRSLGWCWWRQLPPHFLAAATPKEDDQ